MTEHEALSAAEEYTQMAMDALALYRGHSHAADLTYWALRDAMIQIEDGLAGVKDVD